MITIFTVAFIFTVFIILTVKQNDYQWIASATIISFLILFTVTCVEVGKTVVRVDDVEFKLVANKDDKLDNDFLCFAINSNNELEYIITEKHKNSLLKICLTKVKIRLKETDGKPKIVYKRYKTTWNKITSLPWQIKEPYYFYQNKEAIIYLPKSSLKKYLKLDN